MLNKLSIDLIESLLREDESGSLDFKREQYRFIGASNDEKSELLKDMLALANSWKRSNAFILLGVEEKVGGRSIPIGVNAHLSDSDLQQFVNSKTQRNMEFSYEGFLIDGVEIGVIQIAQQKRPIFLRKDFGKLKQKIVYARSGSSTAIVDDPDEIAAMSKENFVSDPVPKIDLAWFDSKSHSILGLQATVDSIFLEVPKKLPDYNDDEYAFGGLINADYYRELAAYTKAIYFAPMPLGVGICSDALVKDVRIETHIEDPDNKLFIWDSYDFPSRPSPSKSLIVQMPQFNSRPSYDITAVKRGSKWIVKIAVGKIQPHATVYPRGLFYVGSKTTQIVNILFTVYADNLPMPQETTLTINFTSASRTVNLKEMSKLEFDHFVNTPKGRRFLSKYTVDDER